MNAENFDFKLGDIVYHRMNDDKNKGMITAINFRMTGVLYEVTWGSNNSSWHYQMELTDEYLPDYCNIETAKEKEGEG
jgi:hypothetical protein